MGEVRAADLPSFEQPPVVEVVVGIHFLQLPGLNTVALIRLADALWRGRYPKTLEQPLMPPLALTGVAPSFSLQFQTTPPPIRLWSLAEDESLLVQIQHDRLLLNWRKMAEDDPYPRYHNLREDFAGLWRDFEDYIRVHDFGELQPSVAEVGFFNRVPMASAAEVPAFIRALNPRWSPPSQVSTAYQAERDLSDLLRTGSQNIALNYHPQYGAMQLEISTHIGIAASGDATSHVLAALDSAHRVGVLTFDEFVTDDARSRWGKQR